MLGIGGYLLECRRIVSPEAIIRVEIGAIYAFTEVAVSCSVAYACDICIRLWAMCFAKTWAWIGYMRVGFRAKGTIFSRDA